MMKMKNNANKQMTRFQRQAAMTLQVGVLCEAIDEGKFAPYLAYCYDEGGLSFSYDDDDDSLRIESGINFGVGDYAPDLIQYKPKFCDDANDFKCQIYLDFGDDLVKLIETVGIGAGEIVGEEIREALWKILREGDPSFYGETYPPLNPPNIVFENPCTRTVEEFIEFFNGLFTETALREIFKTYENWLSDPLPTSVSSDELRACWVEAHPRDIWRDYDGCDSDSIWKTGNRTVYDLAALNKVAVAFDTGGCDVAGMTETRVLVAQ